MRKKRAIKTKLFVLSGTSYFEPIDLTVFGDERPNLRTVDPLIPDDVRDRPKHFFASRNGALESLSTLRSWAAQNICDGDHVVLCDSGEVSAVNSMYVAVAMKFGLSIPSRSDEGRLKLAARQFVRAMPKVGPALEALFFGRNNHGT